MDKIIFWINNNDTIITLVFSFLVTISTIVYAFLTRNLVAETIKMRRIQSDPKIIANIEPTSEHLYLLNFFIENIGNSPAINLIFNVVQEPIFFKNKKISDYLFIKQGIKSISPKSKFQTFLCSTIDEGLDFTAKPIIIEINYEDLSGIKYKEKLIFDLSYMTGISQINKEPYKKITKELEKIQKAIIQKKIYNK